MIRTTIAGIFFFCCSIFVFGGDSPDLCCKCDPLKHSDETVWLTAHQMHAHVRHVEPLRTSGLDKDLDIRGLLVIEARFGPDGRVNCVKAEEGNPVALSAAMRALPKWSFKPVTAGGKARGGYGRLKLRYHLSDKGSSTRIEE